MGKELAKTYDPKRSKKNCMKNGARTNIFTQRRTGSRKPFTTVMPPRISRESCIWDMRWTIRSRIS